MYIIRLALVIYSQDAHVLYVDKYIQMVNILHDLYKVVFKSVIFVFSSFEKKPFGVKYMSRGTQKQIPLNCF